MTNLHERRKSPGNSKMWIIGVVVVKDRYLNWGMFYLGAHFSIDPFIHAAAGW